MKLPPQFRSTAFSILIHLLIGVSAWVCLKLSVKAPEKSFVSLPIVSISESSFSNHVLTPPAPAIQKMQEKSERATMPTKIAQGTEVPSDSSVLNAYFEEVRQRIFSHQHYPLNAKKQHLEGRVEVQLQINSQGRVLSKKCIFTGKNGIFEEAALLAIDESEPFLSPPKGFSGVMTIPIDFRLH